jgi:spore coat protein U-like protein
MNIKMKVLPPLLASLLSLAAIGNANAAGTLTGEIGIRLIVGSGCSVANATVASGVNRWGTVDFGTQSTLVSSVDAGLIGTNGTSTITVTCSAGLTSSLKLNGGQNLDSGLRRMASGATNRVPYRLYSNATRSTEIAIDTPIALVSNGTAQDIPIYGRILPGDQTSTTPAAGTYIDTVLATLTW